MPGGEERKKKLPNFVKNHQKQTFEQPSHYCGVKIRSTLTYADEDHYIKFKKQPTPYTHPREIEKPRDIILYSMH